MLEEKGSKTKYRNFLELVDKNVGECRAFLAGRRANAQNARRGGIRGNDTFGQAGILRELGYHASQFQQKKGLKGKYKKLFELAQSQVEEDLLKKGAYDPRLGDAAAREGAKNDFVAVRKHKTPVAAALKQNRLERQGGVALGAEDMSRVRRHGPTGHNVRDFLHGATAVIEEHVAPPPPPEPVAIVKAREAAERAYTAKQTIGPSASKVARQSVEEGRPTMSARGGGRPKPGARLKVTAPDAFSARSTLFQADRNRGLVMPWKRTTHGINACQEERQIVFDTKQGRWVGEGLVKKGATPRLARPPWQTSSTTNLPTAKPAWE